MGKDAHNRHAHWRKGMKYYNEFFFRSKIVHTLQVLHLHLHHKKNYMECSLPSLGKHQEERGRQPWSSSSGHRCLILEREILLPSLHLELKNLSLENYKEILIKGWHPTSYPQGILNTWSGRCLKYHPSHLTARLDFLVWFTNLTKNYQHWVMQRKNK